MRLHRLERIGIDSYPETWPYRIDDSIDDWFGNGNDNESERDNGNHNG